MNTNPKKSHLSSLSTSAPSEHVCMYSIHIYTMCSQTWEESRANSTKLLPPVIELIAEDIL